jgi:hypothetical protein
VVAEWAAGSVEERLPGLGWLGGRCPVGAAGQWAAGVAGSLSLDHGGGGGGGGGGRQLQRPGAQHTAACGWRARMCSGRAISPRTDGGGLYGRSGCIEDSGNGMAGRGLREGGLAAWLSRADGGARRGESPPEGLGTDLRRREGLSKTHKDCLVARPVAKKRAVCRVRRRGQATNTSAPWSAPRPDERTLSRCVCVCCSLQRAMGTAVGAPYCGGVREQGAGSRRAGEGGPAAVPGNGDGASERAAFPAYGSRPRPAANRILGMPLSPGLHASTAPSYGSRRLGRSSDPDLQSTTAPARPAALPRRWPASTLPLAAPCRPLEALLRPGRARH